MSKYDDISKALLEYGIEFRRDVSMSQLTSIGIGGPADFLITPFTVEEISRTLRILASENIPVFIIGRGTNLLPADEGYRGALVKPSLTRCDPWKEGNFFAGAALPLQEVIMKAMKNGLSGGEELFGIPGSVGGAVAMNAGAYGKWISNILDEIVAFDMTGEEIEVKLDDAFDYRKFKLRGKAVIAECEFTFKSLNEPSLLAKKAIEYETERKKSQPLDERSAGCIFINPPGDHAGRLIEKAGLKGRRIGGAEVSDLHANFIVNKDNASARDVIKLIEIIRESVRKEFGIELETEIITPGYEI